MSPETEREFSYTFVVTVIGLLLNFLISLFVDFSRLGILILLELPMIPILLILITQINKKTFFSLKTISMIFEAFIWSYAIVGCIELCLAMTGKIY